MLVIKHGKIQYFKQEPIHSTIQPPSNVVIPVRRQSFKLTYETWKRLYEKDLTEFFEITMEVFKEFDTSQFNYTVNVSKLKEELFKFIYSTSYNSDKTWIQ
jgi:hypothetical protein